MSKRPHTPENFSRQMKKRITDKHIISDEKLKSLHEKTIQVLFAGARAYTTGNQIIEKSVKKTCSVCHSIADSTCWNCTLDLCCSCGRLCAKCMECFCKDCCTDLQAQLDSTICVKCSK